MADNMELRLRELEERLQDSKQKKYKSLRKKIFIFVISVIAISVSAILIYTVMSREQNPLKSTQAYKNSTFTVYYPSSVPQNYRLDKATASYQNGSLFFQFKDNTRVISFNEQSLPDAPPDLQAIIGFKKIDSPAGNAVLGKNANNPTLVIMTNTTLITVQGTSDVSNDTMRAIAQSMSVLDERGQN